MLEVLRLLFSSSWTGPRWQWKSIHIQSTPVVYYRSWYQALATCLQALNGKNCSDIQAVDGCHDPSKGGLQHRAAHVPLGYGMSCRLFWTSVPVRLRKNGDWLKCSRSVVVFSTCFWGEIVTSYMKQASPKQHPVSTSVHILQQTQWGPSAALWDTRFALLVVVMVACV